MATIKEKLLVLGIKAISYYIRQVTVTCRYSTSMVKNLKFLITLCESIAKIKLSEPRPHSIEFR